MRLIDVDALGIGRANPDVFEEKAYAWGWNTAIDVIEAAPTIDAVPVVRCKDCKWFANNNNDEWFGCWLFNAIRAVPEDAPTPDDFCSYGERRTDK